MARKKIHESPAARMQAYRNRLRRVGIHTATIRLDETTWSTLKRMTSDYENVSIPKLIETLVTEDAQGYQTEMDIESHATEFCSHW